MKNNFYRAAAYILLTAIILVSLAGCSASRPIKSTDEEIAVVGLVDGFEVLYEELRYVTLTYKGYLQSLYGDDIWDSEESTAKYRSELEDLVYRNITANYAVLSLCREVGIETGDKAIQSAVKEHIAGVISEIGGRSAYKEMLKIANITDHFMRFLTEVDYCYSELYYVYVDDLGLIERDESLIYDYIIAGECVRTLHVYIENDPGEDVEENRKTAQDVHDRIVGGEDIKKIIGSSLNEDLQLTTTAGYYFFRGEMLEAYEEAAFALEIGAVSGVVETVDGFYIIQRVALEKPHVLANLDALIAQYQNSQLSGYVAEKQTELAIELNEYGKSLDLTKIN